MYRKVTKSAALSLHFDLHPFIHKPIYVTPMPPHARWRPPRPSPDHRKPSGRLPMVWSSTTSTQIHAEEGVVIGPPVLGFPTSAA